MSDLTGQRIRDFEITSLLGEGGMGKVYRARDTKLKREVAIKVLLSDVAGDPERIARFEREAIALAALHHPHIASLFGMEEAAGQHYLVMELVEGQTLAERLTASAMPIDDAIGIARQIADALEAAHERGIVHRDLKPANIKITPEGTVKVLDFGLAKAGSAGATGAAGAAGSGSAGSVENSPTITSPAMTVHGMILGTAAYMSPEQASGKVVDKRSDIWSFGVVLWEMLTGKRLFEGETLPHTLADVLRAPIDFSLLPATTPRHVRELLRRCLERDAKKRLRDVGEARIALDDVRLGTQATDDSRRARTSRLFGGGWMPWSLVAALSIVVAFLGVSWSRRPPADAPLLLSVDIGPPPDATFGTRPVISPDGRTLAAQARFTGNPTTLLMIRPLDTLSWRVLAGTEHAFGPSWSPDSRSLSFVTLAGKVRRIDVDSGLAQTLCDSPEGFIPFTAWSAEGVILFSGRDGIRRVSASGGESTLVTALDPSQQESLHGIPQFLPDARHFLYFTRSNNSDKSAVLVGSLDAPSGLSNRKRILSATVNAVFATSADRGSDHLLFERDGGLAAQPFDTSTLTLAGSAFPVLDRIGRSNDLLNASVSENGVLVYSSETLSVTADRQVSWFDRSGKPFGDVGTVGSYLESSLSPDGNRLAFARRTDNNDDIWMLDVGSGRLSRVTLESSPERYPVWSRDGARLLFLSRREGSTALYEKTIGGLSPEQLLMKVAEETVPTDWSPDQKTILYSSGGDLWAVADGKSRRLAKTGAAIGQAQFSADGRWVAYSSSESKRFEIYVQSFQEPGSKWMISSGGGTQPRWRRDGKELFYLSLDNRLMAVSLKMGANTFEASSPQVLFQTRLPSLSFSAFHYSVTADGQKFIVDNITTGTTSRPVTVVTNWLAMVKR